VQLLTKFKNPLVLGFAMFALGLATLATNIAANVVGPANDFAHVAPKYVNFRVGGLITGLIGIAIQPWRLIADPTGFIFTWLIGYSLLLGACGGVLIGDYYVLRRMQLDLPGLYRREGPYWYRGGWNPAALVALVVGIAPCVPGFCHAVGWATVDAAWSRLYDYAWFVSFGLSLVVYVGLMKLRPMPSDYETVTT
jgi:NCS1 family nucleobase:cation symporter-1